MSQAAVAVVCVEISVLFLGDKNASYDGKIIKI